MTTQIDAIESNIIFKFVEDVTQSRFINSSAAGFIINSGDGNQTLMPRWGEALNVGPDVREVVPGEFILIEAGKWSFGFYIDGSRYWKTDESMVIGTADEPDNTY